MPQLFDDTPPPCPGCGSEIAKPIIYGDPSTEMLMAWRLGEISLGGVPQEGAMPSWLCECGIRYED